MLTHLLVAVGLSMDAFAVSISSGICLPGMKWRHALRAAFAFGFFQFLMPILGWLGGIRFRNAIQGFDHWIAFLLLVLVGGKMIKECFSSEDVCECTEKSNILNWWGLLVLAVATSIDALAVGLSYSFLGKPILFPAAIIGIVTFCLSLIGCESGRRLGAKFGRGAEFVGGLVLIGIGISILAEHLAKGV